MNKNICSGDGSCFTQTSYGYEKDVNYTCNHNCQLFQCPNYLVCGFAGPKWYLGCHSGVCYSCNMNFGQKLDLSKEKEECPICYEEEFSIKMINCNHRICYICFKKCFTITYDHEDKIENPFEWIDDISDQEIQESIYEKIENTDKYLEYEQKIENIRLKKQEEIEKLSKCCICRKTTKILKYNK